MGQEKWQTVIFIFFLKMSGLPDAAKKTLFLHGAAHTLKIKGTQTHTSLNAFIKRRQQCCYCKLLLQIEIKLK